MPIAFKLDIYKCWGGLSCFVTSLLNVFYAGNVLLHVGDIRQPMDDVEKEEASFSSNAFSKDEDDAALFGEIKLQIAFYVFSLKSYEKKWKTADQFLINSLLFIFLLQYPDPVNELILFLWLLTCKCDLGS